MDFLGIKKYKRRISDLEYQVLVLEEAVDAIRDKGTISIPYADGQGIGSEQVSLHSVVSRLAHEAKLSLVPRKDCPMMWAEPKQNKVIAWLQRLF